MSDYPNERDCEHGHKRGKCVTCDLISTEQQLRDAESQLSEFHARIADLESRVREVSGELTVRMVNDLMTQKDLAAARAKIGELLAGISKIADHGKGFTDEQMHLRIYAATYYRWAKDEAAALVARHQAQQ